MKDPEEKRMKENRATSQSYWWRAPSAWLRRNVVVATSLVAVIALSLFVGYRIADDHARSEEDVIAADIDGSINRVL